MATHVVQSAKAAPGKCILTGTTDGPFLDTGKRLPRYGRVYISIRGLEDALQEMGFLSPKQADTLRGDNDRLQEENRRLTGIEDDYLTLIESVKPHIEVEPEIREVEVVKERRPTDTEIERWVAKKGRDHPAVRNAQRMEKGSPEEWRELYGDVPPGHPDFRRPHEEVSSVEEEARGTEVDLTTKTNVVTIHDQEVDLNEVLDQNVGDVLNWVKGHDEDVVVALVRAEFALAEEKERNVRKGVLEPLGYWDEEEDEPLMPTYEDEEFTDEDEEE